MSRIINTNSPGKERNQMMRTAAEMIRRLSQKAEVDDETRDITALLVLCLKRIDEGIDSSTQAWEKRDYWVKAERFRSRWAWAGKNATILEAIIRNENWEAMPEVLVTLLPYFDEIKVVKFTRKPSMWQGAYSRLISEGTD